MINGSVCKGDLRGGDGSTQWFARPCTSEAVFCHAPLLSSLRIISLTSGGIAILHIAIPAAAPAIMTEPKLRSPGFWPFGVNAIFVASYAAK